MELPDIGDIKETYTTTGAMLDDLKAESNLYIVEKVNSDGRRTATVYNRDIYDMKPVFLETKEKVPTSRVIEHSNFNRCLLRRSY